jgi:hypothetical protein
MPMEMQPGDGLYAVNDIFGRVDMTYGLIAEYLSSKDDVEWTLDFISRDLWKAYNEPSYINLANRFTRALRQVAGQYGFLYSDFVVYTGPLHPLTFMANIEKGLFWKDSFAPDHGEFSHAYQWLCISRRFRGRGGANIPALYRQTANIRAEKPLIAYVGEEKRVSGLRMWPWLCDCFPYSRFPSRFNSVKDTLYHTYSDSCRCPNTIERISRESKDSFIGIMARYRAQKAILDAYMLEDTISVGYKDAGRTARQIKNQRLLNSINLISQAQTLRKERNPNFTALDDDPSSRVFVRNSAALRQTPIPQQVITLHGITGRIPTHVLQGNPTLFASSGFDVLREFHNPEKVLGLV